MICTNMLEKAIVPYVRIIINTKSGNKISFNAT